MFYFCKQRTAYDRRSSDWSSDVCSSDLGDLALELREGQQHVEGEATHRRGGVELLRHRYEGDALAVEDLDDPGEVGERAGQAVDLVDHHDVDFAVANVGKQLQQGRTLHAAAGEAAVVVAGLDRKSTRLNSSH